jgi:cell division protein FtsB
VLGLGLAFLLALLATTGLKGYRDLLATRERERTLEARIEETRERIEHLEERIDRLRDDPLTLERLAREDLGLVEPEDVVIVLPPGTPP